MADTKMTDEQLIKDLGDGLSTSAISAKYDIAMRTVNRRKERLRIRGIAPEYGMTKACPEGYSVKGVSTLYDMEGNIKSQWVKTQSETKEMELEAYKEAFSLFASTLGQIEEFPIRNSRIANEDIMAVYPLGDPHIGMLAWGEETGDDNWDLAIAEEILTEAYERVILSAPPAERCLIVNLGDFFHRDNQEGMTSRSKNILDCDGRYAKMIAVGLRIIRRMISTALTHHTIVEVVNVVGNHDETSALFLSICLSHIYEGSDRVFINTQPGLFHYFKFGKVLIGTHHGHTCKMDKLASVMAASRPKEWGETLHRYWLTGHIHHDSVKNPPGCKVESFRTLAPPDAYGASGGWLAGRDTKAIVYHKDYGEIERHTINICLVKDSIIAKKNAAT